MRRLFVFAVALLLSTKAVDAEVIFDTVDLTSDTWAYAVSSGAIGACDQAFAFEVPTTSDFTLDFLELRLGLSEFSAPNEIRVVVHEDVGLELGGVLEDFLLVDAIPPYTNDTPLLRIDSVTHPVLRAGNRYWVAAYAPEQVPYMFSGAWFVNRYWNPRIPHADSTHRGPWIVNEAEPAEFRVAATPTACSDGVDNDGDGLADFPDDPGCWDTTSIIENPQCQDGLNNDPAQDDLIDFDGGASAGLPPEEQTDPDPQCTHAWQGREARPSCGLGAELALLMPPLMCAYRRRRCNA